MKLSVSLSESDVRALDEYVARRRLASRSAGLQHAVRALRDDALVDEYAAAYAEWDGSAEAADWDRVAGDGLPDASR